MEPEVGKGRGFQTLIGTVKRRSPRPSGFRGCGVSNPHRYGQKPIRLSLTRVREGVSNPHRYGQKAAAFIPLLKVLAVFQTLIGTVKRGLADLAQVRHFPGFKPS